MHAQTGTVGSPEFTGTELSFKVTLRFKEGFWNEASTPEEVSSALAADLVDIIQEDFKRGVRADFVPEVGVRAL